MFPYHLTYNFLMRLRLCLFLCLCLFFSASWADLTQDTVYTTWQQSPSTTMTVQWISSSTEKGSVVAYKPREKNDEWLKATGESFPFPQASQYLIHRVEIKNLQPDTQYQFKVLPGEIVYRFLTAPAKLEKELRFVVGGDMYHDGIEVMAKTGRRAAQTDPLFALLGGDIAYAVKGRYLSVQHIERWVEWVKSWHSTMVTPQGNMIPVLSAIGNHDLLGQYDQTPRQAAIFSLLFPMPGNRVFNVLDFNAYLSIFLLDSGHANPIQGEQTKWLSSALQNRKQIPHLFPIYHVPAYPCVRKFQTKQSVLIRQAWVPLFEKWGVHAVFEHHDHAYKRTYPLLRNRVNPNGVIYLGDGGWGVEKPRKQKDKRSYIAKFAPARHFIAVTITPTQEKFQSITDQGEVLDEVVIPLK